MANMVAVTVLQKNQYALSAPTVWSLPVGQFYVVPASGTVSGQTVHAQVIVRPSGLNQPSVNLLVEETVSAITAAANAPLA